MPLVYTKVIDRARAGPLLSDITLENFWSIVRDPYNAQYLLNAQLRQAEAGLPEGARVELVLRGLYTVEGKKPSDLANQINLLYNQGKMVDPDSGEMLRPWPEHAAARQLAWADDAAGTLTLRWLKGIAWVWYLICAIALGLFAYFLYKMLRGSDWAMYKAVTKTNGDGNGGGCPKIFGVCVWWLAGGAAAIAVAPWLIRQAAKIIRARHELEEAVEETGGKSESGEGA